MAAIASPTCPRCGYDQSGAVAAWNHAESSSCPLTATCSECGLGFEWADVFNTERIRLRGFYEHAGGVALLIAWRTWLWTWNPAFFWRRVRLEHRVRVPRLLLWLVVLLVPLQITHAVSIALERIYSAQVQRATPLPTYGGNSGALPSTIHVNWDGIVPAMFSPIFVNQSSDISWSLTGNGLTLWNTPPTGNVFAPARFGMRSWSPPIALASVFSVTMCGMLLVLPHTRARARVRLHHVLRAAIYGFAWIPLFAVLRLADQAGWWVHELTISNNVRGMNLWWSWSGVDDGWAIREFVEEYWLFVTGVLVLWICWWWLMAVARCFRVSQPVIVWLAMLIPSLLIAVAVLTMTSPQFANSLDGIIRYGNWRWG